MNRAPTLTKPRAGQGMRAGSKSEAEGNSTWLREVWGCVLPGARQGLTSPSSWDGTTSQQDGGDYGTEEGPFQCREQALGMRTSTQFLKAWLWPPCLPREKLFQFHFLRCVCASVRVCLGMGCVGRYVPEPVYVMGQERKTVYMCVHGCAFWGM